MIYKNFIYKSQMMGASEISYEFIPLNQHRNWKHNINPMLQKFAKKKMQTRDLIQGLQFLHEQNDCRRKFNRGKEPYKFEMLQSLYRDDLQNLFGDLAIFLLKYQLSQPILFMPAFKDESASYKKSTIFYLTILMFFGLIPKQPFDKPQNEGHLNCFAHILSTHRFKTLCLVQYLKTTIKQISKQNSSSLCLKIYRNYSDFSVKDKIMEYSQFPLSRIQIQNNQSSIEDFNGSIKIDFANKYIGGGCLRNGCVQEQIMFATRPELYAVTLLCQRMGSHQALAFTGFRRYFNYKGYGDRTSYQGCYPQLQYKMGDNYYDQHIVAIDAVKFDKNDTSQYKQSFINRQIQKAYAGFSLYNKYNQVNHKHNKIITGAWGCGVFNGDFITKIIIQWIAASLAQRTIVICPFGKYEMLKNNAFIETLEKLTISQAGKIKVYQPMKSIWQIINQLMK